MRFVLPLVALALIAAADELPHPSVSPAPAPTPSASAALKKFDPRITPAYYKLLQKQADERKAFFEDQAHAKADLEKKQAQEQEELRETHRAARKQFYSESHPRSERVSFLKNERSQMDSLKARQKAELMAQQSELKKKLKEFHRGQRKESEALASRLVKEHQ